MSLQAQRQTRYSPQETVKIYTDWANHYLERGGCKRRVTDLQADLCDGVLLADLVEAVTNQKVIDVNRKPKSAQQMVENVSLCVGALRALGADVGAVNPGELSTGSTLRPVLALLFALSRHKQRAKQLQDMPRLPSPYNKQTAAGGPGVGPGGTSIPLPATVAATRRCPPDKVRPAPAPAHQTQLGLKHGNGGIGSASSSRSTSPSQQHPPQALSFIPQPRSQCSTNRQPATTPSPRASTVGRPGGLRAPQPSPYSGPPAPVQQTNKNSVLDKFKLFNNKDKNSERGKASSAVSKRTSSSSGFSSARSEHSDSSTSLCDQTKNQVESPKTRALKSKLQAKPTKQASPKSARKEQSKAASKIARTKGPEKLVNTAPSIEDGKVSSKITNSLAKVAANDKKVNSLDLLKQSAQLQKSNSSLTIQQKVTQQQPQQQHQPQQISQDTKIVSSPKAEQKGIQRPKMELPAKITDTRLQQNAKGPPNGLNKGLVPGSNGLIRQPGHDISMQENPMCVENETASLDKTVTTMNQTNMNLSEEKMVENVQKVVDLDSKNGKTENYEIRLRISENHIEEENRENFESNEHESANSSCQRQEPFDDNKIQPEQSKSGESFVAPQTTNSANPLPGPGPNAQGQNVTGPGMSPGSSIPKPTALVKGTTKQQKDINIPNITNPTKLKGESLHRKLDPNTVAMVSPMPSISDLMSESSHSNSNSTGQSNSSDSSVIYRPSSESGSEIKTIPNRKIDTTFEHMEKVLTDSPCVIGTNAEEEAEMTVKPMQPLLRGYTPGARCLQTLPSRTTGRQYTVLHSSSHHHVGQDYSDIDIASGYLSDGEVLRSGVNVGSRTLSDICDGYLSEGGASLYSRRMNPSYGHDHDRYAGGGSRRELSGVKELVNSGSRRVQKRPSASSRDVGGCGAGLLGGCSGGNDELAELTIEDLASIPASNHSSAHGHPSHHKRVPGGGNVAVGGGVGSGSATPQGTQQVYRVVTSRHPGSGHHQHVKKSDSSQQTENSAFKHQQQQQQQQQHQQQQQQSSNCSPNSNSNSQQWKKYIEAGAARDRDREKEGVPSSPSPSRRSQEKHRKQAMAEYANGEKPQKVSSGTSTSSGSSSKVRVPLSFGYVKRHSAGTSPSPNGVQNGGKDPTRTAQVSAVPRTKVKVSGGTQTCTTELQANSTNSNQGHHYKSYSLTGPSASQLSQSVRDRLMLGSQSLPKPGSPEFTALFAAAHHRDRGGGSSGGGSGQSASSFSPRVLKPSDGSLSDTCSNYAAPDLQGYYAPNSPYSTSWMRHSNTYTPSGRSQGMGLCEADSVESLGSHRASLTHTRLLMHQRDSSGSPAPPRLNRSNSIRSTKSEKMYPSMLARGSGASSSVGEEGVGMGIGVGAEPYYSVPVGSTGGAPQHWSQPTSPTPTHSSRQPPNLYQHVHKDDDIHGSSVSLVSTASSLYSSAEEKQAHELRKLRRELLDAQEKVHSLTSRLSVNDHVVQAFEQSLSNMNQRLKQLTATAEKKDSELQELRDTIERLRKQSAEAGLNGATSNGRRHTLGDSDSGTTGCAGYSNNQTPTMARQLSADSVTSLNSLSSACSASSHRKKKGWLGSFSKKFSRARKNRHGSVSDAEDCKDGNTMGDLSAPNSPRLPTAAKHENSHNHNHNSKANGQKSPEHENPMTGSKSSSALYKKEDEDVDDLKEQLRQKDLVLTDITLEALKSSGELHSLKEKIAEMKNEMKNLRENNERLQRLVTSKSLTSSQSSMPTDPERRYSMTEVAYSVTAMSNGDHHPNNGDQMEDINVTEHAVVSTYTGTQSETVIEQDTDGKRISVAVYLGSEKSFNVNLVSSNNEEGVGEPPHCIIASVCISNKTTWDSLDNTVRRCFKDYVSRVDPVTNLGLGVDHVAAYHLGESSRFTNDAQHPELLPCGYLIGHVKTIYLVLTGYSWLAIDTLIPKSIVQRLLSLLTEHRRLILCGPSGTGKNYLAGKLAHALVDADSDADAKDAAAVATFNVDHKSSKELRQYLAHIAERCDSNAADELPKVIILENLQHAASLGELFSGLLGTRHSSCPAIIGTMSQATCSTTNLQLHHNFRWVLCRKDMEPVKGFLGRYLRRKLLEQQLRDTTGTRNPEMAAVVEWLPRVWLHLNKFLETHSSSDVTIGPSLFLSCPMEVAGSQVWFTDLWNYSIRPYLVEAVKEGTGEVAWEDPAQFITTTYPWIATHAVHGGRDALLRLRPEDVGYDVVSSGHNSGVGASSVKSLGSTHSDTEGDPLLNMLMRLQEAANYSSPHSNDSDSVTSMDSSHTRHSEDLSTSTSSSRGVESAL
ncbi:protein sickie isoform X2 [Venturia canescens]|uniref:protein sickie isoform X2 n=1 Tax=Venturia canescens TaxID=32260 RepID=UPI001C9CD5F9|nr:protein sickie isoform X2 [Venturia canescens]